MVRRGKCAVWSTDSTACCAQISESLRCCDFVADLAVDVEQSCAILLDIDGVVSKDLVYLLVFCFVSGEFCYRRES